MAKPKVGAQVLLGQIPKVSVITPCYNGESYVAGCLECMLRQTYPSIELVFVDDGSTDGTGAVFRSYEGRLRAKGVEAVYLYQDNAGQAAAINRGLEACTGDYVTWPDADDLMGPDNLAKKVAFLEGHPEMGLVCCAVSVVRANDGICVGTKSMDAGMADNLFVALLKGDAYLWGVAYMARTSALVGALGGRSIYDARVGQNYQLLLPLAYRFPCGFIGEVLASYVVRADSASHSVRSPKDRLQRTYAVEDVLRHVLDGIGMPSAEREAYGDIVARRYLPERFGLACEMGDRPLMAETKARLDELEGRSRARDAKCALGRLGLYGLVADAKRAAARAARGLRAGLRALKGGPRHA